MIPLHNNIKCSFVRAMQDMFGNPKYIDCLALVACKDDVTPSPTFHHQMLKIPLVENSELHLLQFIELRTLHLLQFILAVLEIIDTIPQIDGGHRGNDFDFFWEIATTCELSDRLSTGAVNYNILRPSGPKRCISFSPGWHTSVGWRP